MTGRAAGYCAGFPTPGYMNPVAGRGYGMQSAPGAYAPGAYGRPMAPYGYGARYAPMGRRAMGGFGFGLGFGFGRGMGRGFGRGGGRGRRWFGW